MLELDADNVLDYLRGQGFLTADPAHAQVLTGGVSNVVIRLETAQGKYVVKQSRPQLRTKDAWFSDLERVLREQEVMTALRPALPPLAVPEVLFVDRGNFLFVMSHAPDDARVWKQALLAGEIDLARGEAAGRLLGRIHEWSARAPDQFKNFHDRRVFVQLRVDPFYRRVQERRPEVAPQVGGLIAEMLTRAEALCHGDYTPKNLLAHTTGFMLVDYETAHVGDPTMDLGLFLSHLLLKAVRLPERRRDYVELTKAFWAGYAREVSFRPLDELQRRGIAHLGACLLARIDGTSPVEYLPEEEKKATARALGCRLLLERPAAWPQVLGICESLVLPRRSIRVRRS